MKKLILIAFLFSSCTESYQDSGGNVWHVKRTCITESTIVAGQQTYTTCDSQKAEHIRQ